MIIMALSHGRTALAHGWTADIAKDSKCLMAISEGGAIYTPIQKPAKTRVEELGNIRRVLLHYFRALHLHCLVIHMVISVGALRSA